jgi:hypothetical protein
MEVPKHPYELVIRLGANDEKSVSALLYDLARRFEHDGVATMFSAGWSGSYSVGVVTRPGVTPDQYREELRQWHKAQKSED